MPFEAEILNREEDPVILLKDTDSGAEAEIYAFGGLLNAFRVHRSGQPWNLIEGFSSVEDAHRQITNGFRSAKLSPFVCRMRHGVFELSGKQYRIEKFYLGEHAIHGLVYDLPFRIVTTHSDPSHASVMLALHYDGSDKGYPFAYDLSVEWKLETRNRLTVSTTVSHQNENAIPYADGWHPYFTLGGSVDDWTLQFHSTGQLEYDADLLPTGKKIADSRFEKTCSLKGIELDNSFELAGDSGAVLGNDALRLHIMPDRSYPILQIYIPPHRKSIAIENLSGAPDNFNNGIGLILLQPDQPKTFSTRYYAELL
ncbi:MAG: aldose 1-epimerase [Chitinophagaceae bacterium]|nr:aldose 1-epimerase [Chitinophagaceae bacterium]